MKAEDMEKVEVEFNKEEVNFRRLNQYGLEDTGYDYEQHLVHPDHHIGNLVYDSRLVAVNGGVQPGRLYEDNDYELHEMDEEHKEVFLALQNDQQGIYDELDEDFIL